MEKMEYLKFKLFLHGRFYTLSCHLDRAHFVRGEALLFSYFSYLNSVSFSAI